MSSSALVEVAKKPDTDARWPWWRKAQAERGVRGWTYAEVARRIGENRENVRRWLQGEVAPREGVVAKLAEVLGWPLDLLTDPRVGYLLEMDRRTNAAWLRATLRDLDENGKKVVASLADPVVAEWLASALEGYRALQQRLRRDRPRPDEPPSGDSS